MPEAGGRDDRQELTVATLATRSILQALPRDEGIALALKMDGFTAQETGEVLDVTPEQARYLLKKAPPPAARPRHRDHPGGGDTMTSIRRPLDDDALDALLNAREALLTLSERHLWATTWALAWAVQRALDAAGGLRRVLAVLALHLVAVHGETDGDVHAAAERAALVVATATPGREASTRARLDAIAATPHGPDRAVAIWAEVAAHVGVPAPIVVLDADGIPEGVTTATAPEDLKAFAAAAAAVLEDDPDRLRAGVERVCALPPERLAALLGTIALMIGLRVPDEARARAALDRMTR
ncbi:hypothetical protein [Embleya sp. NPDC050493]|uniref:hypothetical protein n=1 Tax=Embleya sp. NPDC050493 TaxID=3363989 RepID=UPI0037BB4A53